MESSAITKESTEPQADLQMPAERNELRRKPTFSRAQSAMIVRTNNAASLDEDVEFVLTPFGILTLVIMEPTECHKLDRMVLMKSLGAVWIFLFLCFGVYRASERQGRDIPNLQFDIHNGWEVFDILIGILLLAILVERIKNQTLADFCWIASTKMEANHSTPHGIRCRRIVYCQCTLLVVSHVCIVWATGAVLATSSGIDIYLNSFAVYFLMDIDQVQE
jgi:hypothetical protein